VGYEKVAKFKATIEYFYTVSSTMAGRIIVYGGKGALGSSLVAFFKAKSWVSWFVKLLKSIVSAVGGICGYIPQRGG